MTTNEERDDAKQAMTKVEIDHDPATCPGCIAAGEDLNDTCRHGRDILDGDCGLCEREAEALRDRRERVATAVLAGLVAGTDLECTVYCGGADTPMHTAASQFCIDAADSLIAELEK